MARDLTPPRGQHCDMSDVVLLLVAAAALALLGILAAQGRAADSRDQEWAGAATTSRRPS
jgi:hypothetical protein